MHISRLTIQGYKNLSRGITLESIGRLHVLHGENNVGKSNLLEAVSLPFLLLSSSSDPQVRLPFSSWYDLEPGDFARATGTAIADVFDLRKPQPIDVDVRLELTEQDLQRGAVDPHGVLPAVEVGVTVEPRTGGAAWRIRKFLFGDGQDAAADLAHDLDAPTRPNLRGFALFLARNYVAPSKEIGSTFALVRVDRTVLVEMTGGEGELPRRASGRSPRCLVPSSLALQLYDAKEAMDDVRVGRWNLFREALAKFEDVTGPGVFTVTYDRATERATVVLDRNGTRIPAHLLGSGVQQLVALVGQVLMSGARIVAIEEPETNLRFGLQRRVAELLRELVGDLRGPAQILVSSHSPVFEGREPFDLLLADVDGPRASRMAADRAVEATEHDVPPPPSRGRGPLAYLTSDGVLQMPARLADHLRLPRGGGVVLLPEDEPRSVRVMSNAAWLAQSGEDDGPEAT
jgi:hypothetical protein